MITIANMTSPVSSTISQSDYYDSFKTSRATSIQSQQQLLLKQQQFDQHLRYHKSPWLPQQFLIQYHQKLLSSPSTATSVQSSDDCSKHSEMNTCSKVRSGSAHQSTINYIQNQRLINTQSLQLQQQQQQQQQQSQSQLVQQKQISVPTLMFNTQTSRTLNGPVVQQQHQQLEQQEQQIQHDKHEQQQQQHNSDKIKYSSHSFSSLPLSSSSLSSSSSSSNSSLFSSSQSLSSSSKTISSINEKDASNSSPSFFDYLVDSNSNSNSNLMCLLLDGSSVSQICDDFDKSNRFHLLSQYHLKHCYRYPLLNVLSNNSLDLILGTTSSSTSTSTSYSSSQCNDVLTELVMLDHIVNQRLCEYDLLLNRYDCQTTWSVKWSCQDCRVSNSFHYWISYISNVLQFHYINSPSIQFNSIQFDFFSFCFPLT